MSSGSSHRPRSIEEAVASVRAAPAPVVIRGGGTKSALSGSVGETGTELDTRSLAGVTEYEPSEYTVTVLAGTPVAELEALLAKESQYLPFDPLWIDAGATVGGTIAAGTSGPGRLRYGGVRDFILGVTLVDGTGEPVRGGGKVVKNAAGFDLPKLMVGSRGRLGLLVEVTLKVFPAAQAAATLAVDAGSLETALDIAVLLLQSPLDLAALELRPPGELWIRIAGMAAVLEKRLEKLSRLIEPNLAGGGPCRFLEGEEDELLWRGFREVEWAPAGSSLVKVPLTTREIPMLEGKEGVRDAPRLYGAGCQQLLIARSGDLSELEAALRDCGLQGLVLRGAVESPLLAWSQHSAAFEERVKRALDPQGLFGKLRDDRGGNPAR